MKKIIITLFVFVCTSAAMAQKAKSWSLSINGGVASPSGNFSKTDYDDNTSGYSKTGFHLNLSGIYQVSKSFGINAVVGFSQFGHAGLINLADGYKEDSGTDSTTLTTKGTSGTFSVLVGPVVNIPLAKKFGLHFRVLGGYVSSTLSGFNIYYEDYTDNTIMTQNKATAGAVGFQVGAGLSYAVTDKVSILANADYFNSTPTFNISYQNFNVNSGRRISTYKETISGVNATIGIGFRL